MERYEEWDVSIPPIPPRSRLYRLEPIGIATPYVESLTSYITRLAGEHCLTLKALVMGEIFPSQGKVMTKLDHYRQVSQLWASDGPYLNGVSSIASSWVEMMQSLTLCDGLRFLTMLTWVEVTAGSTLVRQKKAWCPKCYNEWQQVHHPLYEPLLWALLSVKVCQRHRQHLVTRCQYCQAELRFLSQFARQGYCTRCTRWLGCISGLEEAGNIAIDADDFEKQCWIAERVGDLLAAAPKLLMAPTKEQMVTNLSQYTNQYGSVSTLAHMMNVTPGWLWKYLHGDGLPYFNYLLQLCYTLSIPPLEFLTESSLSSQGFLLSPVKDLPALTRSKAKKITAHDVQHMRQVLEMVLAREETASYLSLNEIAKCLGCGVKILRKYCPDLCHAIVMRFKHQRTEDNARTLMKQALESALAGSEPVPLTAVARQIGCAPKTLQKYFPDLCQAVVKRYRERFDYEQVRQGLQKVLNSEEEVPPVTELARQMGYGANTIWANFTDLCRQISARYRAQQQKRNEERTAALCEQIRQVMLLLHRQGIYPGARQTFEQLNNPHILRTIEGHEAWRLMLEELGYPTDKLKRYD